MSDGEKAGKDLSSDVAVLKSQVAEAAKGIDKLDRVLTQLIEEIRKLAISEVERAQDRKQLEDVRHLLNKTITQVEGAFTLIERMENAARDERETQLRKDLDDARKIEKERIFAEEEGRNAWKDIAKRMALRVIETVLISAIAIYVYHSFGVRVPS